MYDTLGFEHEGRKKKHLIIDGQYEDLVLMAKYMWSKCNIFLTPWLFGALKLYEALGLEFEGRAKKHLIIDGEYVDLVLMAKYLWNT